MAGGPWAGWSAPAARTHIAALPKAPRPPPPPRRGARAQGFHNAPMWVNVVANTMLLVHLIPAFQVYARERAPQPLRPLLTGLWHLCAVVLGRQGLWTPPWGSRPLWAAGLPRLRAGNGACCPRARAHTQTHASTFPPLVQSPSSAPWKTCSSGASPRSSLRRPARSARSASSTGAAARDLRAAARVRAHAAPRLVRQCVCVCVPAQSAHDAVHWFHAPARHPMYRTLYVCFTTLIACMLPFFGAFIGGWAGAPHACSVRVYPVTPYVRGR